MEEKYDVLIYPVRFSSKEEAIKDTWKIKSSILDHPKQMTLKEIAQASVSGNAIAFCKAERRGMKALSRKCWLSQQLYAIDFDNKIDGVDLKEPFYQEYNKAIANGIRKGFSPAFVYTTGSHTSNHHRFRLVFALDEPVTTAEEHELILRALFNIYSVNDNIVVDTSCSDLSRIFYPGKKIVNESYKIVSKKKLLKWIESKQKSSLSVDNSKNVSKPVDIHSLMMSIRNE